MKPLEDIYKGAFFKPRYKLEWRVSHICKAVYAVLNPATLIDVGCAIGDVVKGFLDLGVDAFGLEGSERARPFLVVPEERVFFFDLRKPIPLSMQYSVVLCLEVAEHIEPEFADQFVQNLIKLSKRIVLTAAPLGQGGHYHVNCQPKKYWRDKFLEHGYIQSLITAEKIKAGFEDVSHKREMSAWYGNMLYFEKRDVFGRGTL